MYNIAMLFLYCLIGIGASCGPHAAGWAVAAEPSDGPVGPATLIGYTEFRTNLPAGRHANEVTMRAMTIRFDGTQPQKIAAELANEPDSWTQFAGWSPDGKLAIVGRGWNSAENARWEEDHKDFRFTAGQHTFDVHLFEVATGRSTNITGVDRVSDYNHGLYFWPKDPNKLAFTALIGGKGHPFSMDRDGRNKRDLTADSKEFTYGLESSPDGKRIAYHKNYRIHVANADGTAASRIDTGHEFNFAPRWSPDGRWLLFVSGEHYNCHPYVVGADGKGLRKLADRNGYRGVIAFLDVPDFHGGSSDVPCWSSDGNAVFFTAKVGANTELFRTDLAGKAEQLTASPAATLHYHPNPSSDGRWLLFGSQRGGVRQLYVMELATKKQRRLTNLDVGQGAMWAHWQPTPAAKLEGQ